MELDEKDKRILMALQDDAKQSSRDLSKKLNIPATTIHERIKRMEKDGTILGYHVSIDSEKVGMPTTAIVLVRRIPKKSPGKKIFFRKIADLAAKLPEIQEAHLVTGEYDMILKLRGGSDKQVGEYILEKIWRIPEVERTLTLIAFYSAKDTCRLELK